MFYLKTITAKLDQFIVVHIMSMSLRNICLERVCFHVLQLTQNFAQFRAPAQSKTIPKFLGIVKQNLCF